MLLLDEPDNFLDVPGKIWLEQRIRESDKTILFISHDRELLANTATRVVTVELGAAGNLVWTHPGGFASYHEARKDRFLRFEEMRRRWDEEHAKIKALVLRLKIKAEYNDGMASQYKAAQTRLRKFEEKGPPIEQPREQQVKMRLKGGRTGKRAVVCEDLELSGLMKPFDLEVWYGERVAVLGSNGSGKSHFLRLLAAGGSDPDVEHQPVEDTPIAPVRHTGKAKLGARVRPGWFVQTHEHPELVGRTLLEILHRGDGRHGGRDGMGREQAARVLDRYELAHASEQRFESLSGGQQARFQILLLELSGATLLLLDEPTDNLDVQSAEALEDGLEAFEGTVIAVTHDRWFARGFDRFLVYGADGDVYESDGPVWDEGRVTRDAMTDRDELEISDLDPFDDAEVDEWHAVYDAAQTLRARGDGDAVGARRAARRHAGGRPAPVPARASAAGSTDGSSSTGYVEGSLLDNLELAELQVNMHPDHRAAGATARAMLGALRGRSPASAAGPRCSRMVDWPYDAAPARATATPASSSRRTHGYAMALVEIQRRLDLPVAEETLDRLAAERRREPRRLHAALVDGPGPRGAARRAGPR